MGERTQREARLVGQTTARPTGRPINPANWALSPLPETFPHSPGSSLGLNRFLAPKETVDAPTIAEYSLRCPQERQSPAAQREERVRAAHPMRLIAFTHLR